ncbi:MAG: HNH endonuclease, partial [Elusimicrobia bacterium]|nr:HNH endonuclease [Elusimicrobiota bacterium]
PLAPPAEAQATSPSLAAPQTAPALVAAATPQTAAGWAPPVPRPFDRVEALTESLARIAFTADRTTVTAIERACELMGCTRSNLSRVMASAVEALLDSNDPDRVLARKRPRKPRAYDRASRRIPQHVRDAVWKRDEGRCVFVSDHGKRCTARRNLEFDHIVPYAAGGASDDPDNIRLLCALHNLGAARDRLGTERLSRAIGASRRGKHSVQKEPPDERMMGGTVDLHAAIAGEEEGGIDGAMYQGKPP